MNEKNPFIQKIVERVNKYAKAVELLKNLKIDWETDVDKMDFSKLRSRANWQGKIKGIEYRNPKKNDFFWDSEMIDLVHFISENTTKIIPPFLQIRYEIENDKEILIKDEWLMDGNHRAKLSGKINLTAIPYVIFEKKVYAFDAGMHYLKINKSTLNVKDKNEKTLRSFDLNLSQIHIYEDHIEDKIMIDVLQ